MNKIVAIFSLLLLGTGAAAQQLPPAPDLPNPSVGSNLGRPGLGAFFTSRTPYEFWLTCIIASFGLIVILLLLWHVRNIPDRRTEDVTRAVVVVMVITGTLILVTAGYSNDQIAPAFGLFGTIVGYILGRLAQSGSRRNGDVQPDTPEGAGNRTAPPAGPPV